MTFTVTLAENGYIVELTQTNAPRATVCTEGQLEPTIKRLAKAAKRSKSASIVARAA